MRTTGDDILDEVMNLERQYGGRLASQYVDQMRAAAPGYFDIRDKYEGAISSDLDNLGQLSPEQQRLVQQNVRAGQSARGNIMGVAPTAQEVMSSYLASDALKDKQLGRAYQYAATPAPGVSVGNTPSVMAAYRAQPMPQFSSQQLSPGMGMGMGQQGSNMAQQQYGQAYGGYQNAMANYQSPWATVAQVGLGAAGAFC